MVSFKPMYIVFALGILGLVGIVGIGSDLAPQLRSQAQLDELTAYCNQKPTSELCVTPTPATLCNGQSCVVSMGNLEEDRRTCTEQYGGRLLCPVCHPDADPAACTCSCRVGPRPPDTCAPGFKQVCRQCDPRDRSGDCGCRCLEDESNLQLFFNNVPDVSSQPEVVATPTPVSVAVPTVAPQQALTVPKIISDEIQYGGEQQGERTIARSLRQVPEFFREVGQSDDEINSVPDDTVDLPDISFAPEPDLSPVDDYAPSSTTPSARSVAEQTTFASIVNDLADAVARALNRLAETISQ